MNLNLKIKLTISYVLLSLFLVISLLVVSNYFLEQKFQSYVIKTQEQKNKDIVDLVIQAFGKNGEIPSIGSLENIGNTALTKGLILMVSDLEGKEIFCMSTLDSQMCENMIDGMRAHMVSIYPNFNGEYIQKYYDITKNNAKVGTVTLGYYGPFYYNEEDIQFLQVLNKLFVIVAIVFLIIAALLGFMIANGITRPIKKVIDKTRQIEKGNYTDRITTVSKINEMNQLIHSINALTETLEKQQISKKRMARDYAHEFRTPLTALQSSLEAMIDGIWEPTEARLESCREEILRLTRMISNMDKLVRIEDDSVSLYKTKFNLANVVEQTVMNFTSEMAVKNIAMETDLNTCEIYADKDKIIQVVINLMSNAVKYTDCGGKIKVKVKKNDNDAVLSVSDSGIGISEEDLPNIYEHLYRTDKSRSQNTGGSGIGLSIVKAIVEAHNGTIVTKSELLKGSVFTIKLPISK